VGDWIDFFSILKLSAESNEICNASADFSSILLSVVMADFHFTAVKQAKRPRAGHAVRAGGDAGTAKRTRNDAVAPQVFTPVVTQAASYTSRAMKGAPRPSGVPTVRFVGHVTPDDIAAATARAVSMGALRNSIRSGNGNVPGFIGEEVLMRVLRDERGLDVAHVDGYHYDIAVNGHPLEIKTKQIYTNSFRADYDNAVCAFNARQKGTYVFLRLQLDARDPARATIGHLWFCGCWDSATFKDTETGAEFLQKGQTKPGFNNWRVKASCYNRKIGECRDWAWLLAQLHTPVQNDSDSDTANTTGAAATATGVTVAK
jgi:hypothetical protein